MAWASATQSELLTTDANWEAFHDGSSAIVIALNPYEVASFIFGISSLIGETDNLEWQILGGHRVSNGLATGTIGSTTVLDLHATDAAEANDYWVGQYFVMTSGGETKDVREIIDFVSSTEAATLVRALSGTPTETETYAIYAMSEIASGSITSETTLTEDLPQNAASTVSGYPFLIARARATGGTDAHIALMTYSVNNVSA